MVVQSAFMFAYSFFSAVSDSEISATCYYAVSTEDVRGVSTSFPPTLTILYALTICIDFRAVQSKCWVTFSSWLRQATRLPLLDCVVRRCSPSFSHSLLFFFILVINHIVNFACNVRGLHPGTIALAKDDGARSCTAMVGSARRGIPLGRNKGSGRFGYDAKRGLSHRFCEAGRGNHFLLGSVDGVRR